MSLDLDKSAWKRVTFGDVVKNLNVTVHDTAAAGIDRIIAMEHLDPGELQISRWSSPEDGTTFTRRVRPGQTLFGKRRAYQRKVAYAEFDAICSGDILVFEADPTMLLPEFLPFIVQSNSFYRHALATSAGSLSPRTNWRDLATIEFDLPALDEQQRLAGLLWAVERARDGATRLQETHDSFMRKFCAETYEQCVREFPTGLFTDLGELKMGRQKAPKYMTGVHPRPYLRVANIGSLELVLGEVEEMEFGQSDFAKFKLEAGDVLLTEGDIVSAMNVGRPALFAGEIDGCCFQNTLIRFRPSSEVDSYFAVALFEGMRLAGVFAGAASTTTVTHLGLKRLAEVTVPLVPRSAQRKVTAGFAGLLEARRALRAEVEALVVLKRRLSAEVLS